MYGSPRENDSVSSADVFDLLNAPAGESPLDLFAEDVGEVQGDFDYEPTSQSDVLTKFNEIFGISRQRILRVKFSNLPNGVGFRYRGVDYIKGVENDAFRMGRGKVRVMQPDIKVRPINAIYFSDICGEVGCTQHAH